MVTKLAETMNKTVIIIHKTFICFLKTVLANRDISNIHESGRHFCVFFLPHFTTLIIGMNSF